MAHGSTSISALDTQWSIITNGGEARLEILLSTKSRVFGLFVIFFELMMCFRLYNICLFKFQLQKFFSCLKDFLISYNSNWCFPVHSNCFSWLILHSKLSVRETDLPKDIGWSHQLEGTKHWGSWLLGQCVFPKLSSLCLVGAYPSQRTDPHQSTHSGNRQHNQWGGSSHPPAHSSREYTELFRQCWLQRSVVDTWLESFAEG